MQVVIEIDEHIYKQIMADSEVYILDNEVDQILIENAIYNGTPLPKGHGDLIDRKDLIENGISKGFCDWYNEIKIADTIIEADRGSGNE